MGKDENQRRMSLIEREDKQEEERRIAQEVREGKERYDRRSQDRLDNLGIGSKKSVSKIPNSATGSKISTEKRHTGIDSQSNHSKQYRKESNESKVRKKEAIDKSEVNVKNYSRKGKTDEVKSVNSNRLVNQMDNLVKKDNHEHPDRKSDRKPIPDLVGSNSAPVAATPV